MLPAYGWRRKKDWTRTLIEETMIIIFYLKQDGTGGTAGMVPRVLRDRQGYQDNQEHPVYQVSKQGGIII